MSSSRLTDLSALELSTLVHQNEVTCCEVVSAHLDRIAEVDGRLGAFVSQRPRDAVLEEAAHRDAELRSGRSRGWMHGLPYAVKDLVDVQGLPTTHGFIPVAEAAPADEDEPFVRRIRQAGAVVVGKTNTPEFGLGSHTYNTVAPPTRNVADPSRSAGGSSGGAAVAVASGMVPVADGSDFMGSLRNPPGWNGVLGFRPSPGVIPEAGPDELEPGCSTAGPLGRTVDDLVALLNTMADPRRTVTPTDVQGTARPRIGWLADLGGYLPFDAGVLENCHGALDAWPASVSEVGLPSVGAFTGAECLWDTWLTTRFDEVGGWLAAEYSDGDVARMKPEARWEIEGFHRLTDQERERARAVRRDLTRSVHTLFESVDLLVLPTAQVWPFPVDRTWPERVGDKAMDTYHRWMEVTTLATLVGMPTLAVPAAQNDDGLFVGLQLMGPPRADGDVLAWGLWAERHAAFTVRPPTSM
jgi:amidase